MLFKDLTPTSHTMSWLTYYSTNFQSLQSFQIPLFAERRPLRDSHFTHAFFASFEPERASNPTIYTYAFGYAVAIKFNDIDKSLVGVEGFEPSRYCYQRILSPICLPIPTYPHFGCGNWIWTSDVRVKVWCVTTTLYRIIKCARWESNPRHLD